MWDFGDIWMDHMFKPIEARLFTQVSDLEFGDWVKVKLHVKLRKKSQWQGKELERLTWEKLFHMQRNRNITDLRKNYLYAFSFLIYFWMGWWRKKAYYENRPGWRTNDNNIAYTLTIWIPRRNLIIHGTLLGNTHKLGQPWGRQVSTR